MSNFPLRAVGDNELPEKDQLALFDVSSVPKVKSFAFSLTSGTNIPLDDELEYGSLVTGTFEGRVSGLHIKTQQDGTSVAVFDVRVLYAEIDNGEG